MVRAKLVCYEKAEFQGWDSKAGKYCRAMKFKFQIVSSGQSPENDFYSHISGGTNMEIATINESVFEQFKVNGEYYADLSPAGVPTTTV